MCFQPVFLLIKKRLTGKEYYGIFVNLHFMNREAKGIGN